MIHYSQHEKWSFWKLSLSSKQQNGLVWSSKQEGKKGKLGWHCWVREPINHVFVLIGTSKVTFSPSAGLNKKEVVFWQVEAPSQTTMVRIPTNQSARLWMLLAVGFQAADCHRQESSLLINLTWCCLVTGVISSIDKGGVQADCGAEAIKMELENLIEWPLQTKCWWFLDQPLSWSQTLEPTKGLCWWPSSVLGTLESQQNAKFWALHSLNGTGLVGMMPDSWTLWSGVRFRVQYMLWVFLQKF